MSGISAASAASAAGTKMRLKPFCRALAAIGSTPRECRTVPSSESSPTTTASSRHSAAAVPASTARPPRSAGRMSALPCAPRPAPGSPRFARADMAAGVLHRRLHARTALLYCLVRQSHNIRAGQALRGIDLDLHDHPLQPDHRARIHSRQHAEECSRGTRESQLRGRMRTAGSGIARLFRTDVCLVCTQRQQRSRGCKRTRHGRVAIVRQSAAAADLRIQAVDRPDSDRPTPVQPRGDVRCLQISEQRVPASTVRDGQRTRSRRPDHRARSRDSPRPPCRTPSPPR